MDLIFDFMACVSFPMGAYMKHSVSFLGRLAVFLAGGWAQITQNPLIGNQNKAIVP